MFASVRCQTKGGYFSFRGRTISLAFLFGGRYKWLGGLELPCVSGRFARLGANEISSLKIPEMELNSLRNPATMTSNSYGQIWIHITLYRINRLRTVSAQPIDSKRP